MVSNKWFQLEFTKRKKELLQLFNKDPTSDFVTRLNKPYFPNLKFKHAKKQHQNVERRF